MKTKIEIKTWAGTLLFSHEEENNTVKKTLEAAVKTKTNLRNSDLRNSNLSGSNLRNSDLSPIRDDFWAVLSSAPGEVGGLREAILKGKIDGSTYEGECACLVGTIANVKGCNYEKLDVLKPSSSRPAERFFLGIRRGDTPETSQFSKLALEWLDSWVANVSAAFSK